jgi:hypothetical protein
MLAATLIDPDMSASVLLRSALTVNPPAIRWTLPPGASEYRIELDPLISVEAHPQTRSLTAEEEDLVWAALRASSELLYRF